MASWFHGSGKRAAHCPIPVLCVPVPLCPQDPKEKKNKEVSNRSRHAGWRAPGLDVGDSTWVQCDSVGVARLPVGASRGAQVWGWKAWLPGCSAHLPQAVGAPAGRQAGEGHDENDRNSDCADNSRLLRVFIAPLPRCPSPGSWECFTDVT